MKREKLKVREKNYGDLKVIYKKNIRSFSRSNFYHFVINVLLQKGPG